MLRTDGWDVAAGLEFSSVPFHPLRFGKRCPEPTSLWPLVAGMLDILRDEGAESFGKGDWLLAEQGKETRGAVELCFPRSAALKHY